MPHLFKCTQITTLVLKGKSYSIKESCSTNGRKELKHLLKTSNN